MTCDMHATDTANLRRIRSIFRGLSPAQETFVRVYVERFDAFLALRASGLIDPGYPATVCVERIMADPEVETAIAQYRKHVSEKPAKAVSLRSIMSDLQVVFELALASNDLQSGIEAKRLQLALVLENAGNRHEGRTT